MKPTLVRHVLAPLAILSLVAGTWAMTLHSSEDTLPAASGDLKGKMVFGERLPLGAPGLTMDTDVFLAPILLDPGSGRPVRVVEVTLDFLYRSDLLAQAHLFRFLDPLSSEPITATLTLAVDTADPPPEVAIPTSQYSVTISPGLGVVWGMVDSFEQLQVSATL
jgi:hypothetical protein